MAKGKIQIDVDDLPPVLSVADIQKFLGVSKSSAYELVESNQFHVVKVGRIYKVSKQSFKQWFVGTCEQGAV